MTTDRTSLVALFGLPNTGKTSLFNGLTDSRAKVGNYPGITVERRTARCQLNREHEVDLLDVPGAYSLVAQSVDEQIALEAILGLEGLDRPDVVIACVDATSPMRGLYVALQLLELGTQVVVALTMIDEAESGAYTEAELSEAIGCQVVAVDARRGRGLRALRSAVSTALAADLPTCALPWSPSSALRAQIEDVRPALPDGWRDCDALALWALMSVGDGDELRNISPKLRAAVARHASDGAAIDDEVVTKRYAWIKSRMRPLEQAQARRRLTQRIDRVLIHRVRGLVIFVGLMVIMFQALFSWCDPLIALIEQAFEWLSVTLANALPEHLLSEMLIDGLIAGVGAFVVFLPQILLLFFFIGLLEDLGYMARVAVLMDRIMSKMNLNGRAFIPMLSGFACAVPAVLATRTMPRRRDRLLTMMVVPLMTCSARLPVYSLIIAALIPAGSVWGIPTQGLLMVSMYLFSVTTALVAAWVLSKTLPPLRGKRLPLVLELPPYRLPRLGDVAKMMWERTAVFVREAGTVILVCTVVLWALLAFPRAQPLAENADVTAQRESAAAQISNSYAGRVGHAIEPGIAPLGYDWKIGIGIVGAFAAREVFVSTMGVVYAVESSDDDPIALRQQLQNEQKPEGGRAYTPLVGLSLMIFFALACQCMSTLAVVKRETNSYRWPAFLFVYMTTLAWLMSFAVFQLGSLLGFG